MTTSEKFCLKWNDFQENVTTAFVTLKDDTDFTDVTLVCEDNKQIEVHKVILASSSSIFQNMLKRNKHNHPLIYLKGMRYEDLLAVIDFIYLGETNIYQENLDSFLSIAEDLCLKGLARETQYSKCEYSPNKLPTERPDYLDKSKHSSTTKCFSNINRQHQNTGLTNSSQPHELEVKSQPEEIVFDNTVSLMEDDNQTYKFNNIKKNEDLNKTLNSMITQIGETWTCNSCGKVSNEKRNIKTHVENMHTEGLEFPCPRCDKMFRSRKSVYNHTASNHK